MDLHGRSRRQPRGGGRGLGLLAAGVAIGMAAGYLLDPEAGHGRRTRLHDRGLASLRRFGRQAARLVHHVTAEVEGRARQRLHAVPPPPVDDQALLDRVASRLFLERPEFKGRINLEAERGHVRLRGQLASEAEIDDLMTVVWRVDGVRSVESLLHLPGTPAPNKEAAIRSSRAALERRP